MNAEIPEWVDRRLGFRSTVREGTHYLFGNPHTFRGRMSAWHEEGYTLNVSREEIVDASEYALVWMDGYFAGSEPPPPPTDDPADEEAWNIARAAYRSTGNVEHVNVDSPPEMR
jgi:hypothetical protein